MPIVFGTGNKRGDYSGYFTNSLNQPGVGLYGSTAANKFVQDAKNGRDCLDVVIVGDSNCNYNNRGWIYSWEKGLVDAGAKPYATCLIPATHAASTNVNAGWGIGVNYATLQAGVGSQSFVLAGTAAAGASALGTAISQYWTSDGTNLRTWATGLDWAYITATGPQEGGAYTELTTASALEPQQELVYRVGCVRFPSGSGRFVMIAYSPAYSGTVALQIQQTKTVQSLDPATTYSLKIEEMTLAADPVRAMNTRFGWLGNGYGGAAYGPIGPSAVLFESIYAKRKGFAVNMLSYYPGSQTGQTATRWATANARATAKTYLTELRNRQLAAGGTGRVLVFVNSSVNDVGGGTIGQFDVNANSIIGTFTQVWTSAGFPTSDLAFVISRTHPTEAGDATQAVASVLGKQKVSTGTTGNVTFIDTNELIPNSVLTANSYYDGGGTSHLTAAGYQEAGSRLITRLLQ